MAPVLDQVPRPRPPALPARVLVPGEPVQGLPRIGAEPGEDRHVVGAAEDVDGVELQEPDVVDRPPQVPGIDPPARPRAPEALRRDRQAPGLVGAEVELSLRPGEPFFGHAHQALAARGFTRFRVGDDGVLVDLDLRAVLRRVADGDDVAGDEGTGGAGGVAAAGGLAGAAVLELDPQLEVPFADPLAVGVAARLRLEYDRFCLLAVLLEFLLAEHPTAPSRSRFQVRSDLRPQMRSPCLAHPTPATGSRGDPPHRPEPFDSGRGRRTSS